MTAEKNTNIVPIYIPYMNPPAIDNQDPGSNSATQKIYINIKTIAPIGC